MESAVSKPLSVVRELQRSVLHFQQASISAHFSSVSLYVLEVAPQFSPVRMRCFMKLQRARSQSDRNFLQAARSKCSGT